MAAEPGANYVRESRVEDDKLVTQERRAELAREKVRCIRHHQICSQEWFSMIDQIQDLSGLAKVETYCPKVDQNWHEQEGRSGEGTLWDQRVSEVALRVLVEDAKVVACLRLLHDLKQWQYDDVRYQADITTTMKWSGCSADDVVSKVGVFEESLSHILTLAYTHVEAMQLSDMALNIEHVRLVLQTTAERNLGTENSKLQETQCMFLLLTMAKHIENFNTVELLERMQEARVLPLLVAHLRKHSPAYGKDVLLKSAEGLAGLCESEDFLTVWEGFFTTEERVELVALEKELVLPLIQQNPARKSEYRPFTDFVNKVRRKTPGI